MFLSGAGKLVCVITYKDSGGDGRDIDELLHLVLVGVPLVIEAGHVGAHVVAGVIVSAGVILGGVWLAVLLLHSASVLVDDPVIVGLGPGTVTPESSPSSPDGNLVKLVTFYFVKCTHSLS